MHLPVVARRLGRVFFAFIIVALAGFGTRSVVKSGSAAADGQAAPEGEKVYLTRCMSCHQMNGEGVANVFPPLAGSEWVTGDEGRLVRVILHGLTGTVEVAGTQYAGAMPPWGTFMKDDEIAAVATYIRSSWGNEADALTEAEVAAVRAATADRKAPYTAAELALPVNQGIPE